MNFYVYIKYKSDITWKLINICKNLSINKKIKKKFSINIFKKL